VSPDFRRHKRPSLRQSPTTVPVRSSGIINWVECHSKKAAKGLQAFFEGKRHLLGGMEGIKNLSSRKVEDEFYG
jgi:hypothetical protein